MSSNIHDRTAGPPHLTISPDGYVRLRFKDLRAVPIKHLLSELDSDPADVATGAAGACAAAICGYTEWLSQGVPSLSLGWDWQIETVGSQVRYRRQGEIRSNIMLVDEGWRDLEEAGTGPLLCRIVDELNWQHAVSDYITNRYACHLSNLTVTQNFTTP